MSTPEKTPTSRIPGFFKLSHEQRLQRLVHEGWLGEQDIDLLRRETPLLPLSVADSMVENVIGVYGLPLGLGLNFTVNGKDYVVPMAVEEPSVVAAVSHTAKIVRASGGFSADADDPVMIGQIQVVGCEDAALAAKNIMEHKAELLRRANALQPRIVARGGGAQDLEVRVIGEGSRYDTMVVIHLLVDCRDAMGANMINTMAEGLAPFVEELTGGRVFLRILSNLADRRRVRARCRIPAKELSWKGYSGQEVAEGIAKASAFAELDPYRAATHNKGVMNGIDAVAIATGNDWRAIEAGAHAFCALQADYMPMATWHVNEGGDLIGRLDIPIQVGTVGGPIRLHPIAKMMVKMLNLGSAAELAQLMGAVGLAQNLAALKALATEGIQPGHMSLHARSVAATAGASGDLVGHIAEQLILEGDIKVARAQELLLEHGVDLSNQADCSKQSG